MQSKSIARIFGKAKIRFRRARILRSINIYIFNSILLTYVTIQNNIIALKYKLYTKYFLMIEITWLP